MREQAHRRRTKAARRALMSVLPAGLQRNGASWNIGYVLVAAATIVAATACLVAGEGQGIPELPPPQPPSSGPGILVAGDGAAETYAFCIACHSERLVAQQGLTRQGWEEVIELMMEEHGMAPIESPYLERVLAYLSTHYGPDRPNFPLR